MHTAEASIYTAILIASSCIGLIVLFFVVTITYQQRRYRKFFKNRVSAEIEHFEHERRILSEELHDDVGPLLFTAKNKVEEIQALDEQSKILQQESLQYLATVAEKLRSFNREEIPSSLFAKGLPASIETFFRTIQLQTPVELSFDVRLLPDLPEAATIHVYRIMREIIFNTLKHSGAKSITIEMYQQKRNLIINTADDGCGFDHKEKIHQEGGQGLKNIFNRIEILEGDLQVDSVKGRGTCYYITIPLTNQVDRHGQNLLSDRG